MEEVVLEKAKLIEEGPAGLLRAIHTDAEDAFQRIESELFPSMLDCSAAAIEDLFRTMEQKFRLGKKQRSKWEENFQQYKELQSFKREVIENLTDEEATGKAALERLKSTQFFQLLVHDFDTLGLVGESENAILLYIVVMSVKRNDPLHASVFGSSAAGKTSLVKTVLSLIPKDSKWIIGSASARAFDYLDPAMTHEKIMFIEEFEGAEAALNTLRIIMSEKNASRLVTIQDPKTQKFKAQLSQGDHKFSLVTTTTRAFIQQETANRLFCLYIDQARSHIAQVGEKIRGRHTISYRARNSERVKILRLHQAIHRLLRNVEVNIPFSDRIRFPHEQARHNRDLEKFLNLIEVIAFIRQEQKDKKSHEGVTYVEADIEDYRLAHRLLPFVLSEAIDELSVPEQSVLRVAIEEANWQMGSRTTSREDAWITTRSVMDRASVASIDVGDQTRVGHIMNSLEFKGFLECTSGRKQGSRRKYILPFAMSVNKDGNIEGIRPSLMSQVSTPEELESGVDPTTVRSRVVIERDEKMKSLLLRTQADKGESHEPRLLEGNRTVPNTFLAKDSEYTSKGPLENYKEATSQEGELRKNEDPALLSTEGDLEASLQRTRDRLAALRQEAISGPSKEVQPKVLDGAGTMGDLESECPPIPKSPWEKPLAPPSR